jgi:hypothetical protein
MKFQYPVYNPCVTVVDVAADWSTEYFDTTQDRELAMAQPFRVAAVRAFYNQPDIFGYDPAIAKIDVSEFDLVLISDIEYFKHQAIEAWAAKNNIKNYLLAVGGIQPTDQLDHDRMVYRHYNIDRYLCRNQCIDTSGIDKPFLFDCMLGARRPHRDYVMLALTRTGLLDRSIVTYRAGFPGEVVNEYNKIFADQFPGTKLNWPYVSPNLDPAWEVSDQVTNHISCVSPDKIFQNTHYSIICETLGTGDDFFLSEKTVKAMFARRVFVVFGPRHFLRRLHELGFQTFDAILDESYDDEPVDEIRYQKAMLQLLRLAYFLTPAQVHHYVGYAVDNNFRNLPHIRQQTNEKLQELLIKHIPRQHWSY